MSSEETRVQPLYWSIRREVWENPSIYMAPLASAAVFLFGFSLGMITLPRRVRSASSLDPSKLDAILVTPFSIAATVIVLTAYIVGAFYCLEALHAERSDRSILFWKSLPVSDLFTVLSKAGVPLAVLPVVGWMLSLVTRLAMLFLSTAALTTSGVGAVELWTRLPLFQMTLVMLYGLVVFALWHAPLYAWLLLVSGWARRMPLLWVVLPPLGLAAFEGIVFRTSYFGSLLRYRLIGPLTLAFSIQGNEHVMRFSQLTPGRFLISPSLWLGLAVAASVLWAAARQRRHREPL